MLRYDSAYSFISASPPARSAIAWRSCFWKSSSMSSSSQLSSHSCSVGLAVNVSATVVVSAAVSEYHKR